MKIHILYAFTFLSCLWLSAGVGLNVYASSKRTVTFQPPPRRERPVSSVGGGTRNQGRCPRDSFNKLSPAGEPSLMALVPRGGEGLTLSAHPSIWIKVAPTSAQKLIFYLREEKSKKTYYQTSVKISPGLLSLSLPPNLPPLETGKVYLWSAVLVCDDSPAPDDPSVTAAIERVELNTVSTPAGLDAVIWYAERGIWYDALDRLASLRRSDPDNPELRGVWEDLLRSAGVGETSALSPQESGK